jgi:hypothetical protein
VFCVLRPGPEAGRAHNFQHMIAMIKIIFQQQTGCRKNFFNRPGFCAEKFSIGIRLIGRNPHVSKRKKL